MFFKHRYLTTKSNDKNYHNNIELYSTLTYDNFTEDLTTTGETANFLKNMQRYDITFNYDSSMNKVCKYVESQLSPLKQQSILVNSDVAKLLKTNKESLSDYNKINYIKELSDRYYDNKAKFKQGINDEYANIDQYAKVLREESLSHFENSEELANYVVEVCYIQRYHSSKSFAWNVFGKFLLENLQKNTETPIRIPLRSEDGDIEYLFNQYKMYDVILNNKTEDGEDGINASDF